jgi:hypothetical protein
MVMSSHILEFPTRPLRFGIIQPIYESAAMSGTSPAGTTRPGPHAASLIRLGNAPLKIDTP